MKDCRKNSSTADDGDNQYACIKVFTTIDSPMEDVCEYLSREDHMEEYNGRLDCFKGCCFSYISILTFIR